MKQTLLTSGRLATAEAIAVTTAYLKFKNLNGKRVHIQKGTGRYHPLKRRSLTTRQKFSFCDYFTIKILCLAKIL